MAPVSLVSRFGIAQTCKQMASPLLALAQELAEEEQWGQCISAIDEAMGAIGRELLRDAEEEEAPSHSEEAPSHSEEDSEGAPCGEGLRATASELEEGSEV